MCLFVALRAFGHRPIKHQNLNELTMALKDSGYLPEVQPLSKSKVRGVFSILKQAELVVKHTALLEDVVQVYLIPEIDTFEKLRDGHDRYLQHYMVENLLQVPAGLLGEVIWYVSAEEKQRRLEHLEGLIKVLEPVAVEVLASSSFGKGSQQEELEELDQ